MLNKVIKYSICIFALSLLAVSCRTHKNVASEKTEIYKMPYETFSSKTSFSFSMDGVHSVSFGGQVRIKKDSVIFFSIQPIAGVEVARAVIDTSGVLLVDRMNKRYFSTSFAEMKTEFGFDVNYHSIQAVLSNVPFAYEKNRDAYEKDFTKTEIPGNKILLQRVYDGLSQEFVVDSLLQSGTILSEMGDIKWNYMDFSTFVGGRRFPMKTEIMLKSNHRDQSSNQRLSFFSLSLSHRKIETNVSMNFNYKVPDSYQKISSEEIVELYFKNK